MTNILENITIVDLTQAMAGPYATMMLGDMGAKVIKIERPGKGDQSRGWGPPFIAGESTYFLSINRNKKSLSLNIGSEKGRKILHNLIKHADIFIHNIPKQASRERAQVDETTLRKMNPRLIYCSVSGYGSEGPYADRPGYDMVAQGEAGLMSLTGTATPNGAPFRFPIPLADMATGMYATIAMLGALYARERTGEGQALDITLLESQSAWSTILAGSYLNGGVLPPRLGNDHPSIVPYQIFKTADKYIIVAVGTEKLWASFCQSLGLQHLQNDSRFATNADRLTHREEITAELDSLFQTKPADYWLNKLKEAGIPNGPINRIPDMLEHPQLRARGFIVELEHPLAGMIKMLGNPAHFSDTPVSYRTAPPMLGEHTAEILRQLNYSEDAISQLKADGIV